jgi:hypothetical protein
MKTIAATALILALTASAFAAEPRREQTPEPRKAAVPIVLTATQMDVVTAGDGRVSSTDLATWQANYGTTSSTDTEASTPKLAQFAIKGNSP